jgi:outer membrane protein with beta-barrel domain
MFMKKLLIAFLLTGALSQLSAQDSLTTSGSQVQDSIIKANAQPRKLKKDWSKVNIDNRTGDHFMMQFGINTWTKAPDTIAIKGFSRTFNAHLMYDMPFKTNPRFSVALGVGVGVDNTYFDKVIVDITGRKANRLSFEDVSDTTHFKKYKITNTYLEVPLELRFTSNPESYNKSFKAAIGAKVGTMVSAVAKGKTLQTSSGGTINAYTDKEKSKRFFNSTRLAVTGRVGYGIFSLFAVYQINAFIKEGFGPDIRPLQVGIAISGL